MQLSLRDSQPAKRPKTSRATAMPLRYGQGKALTSILTGITDEDQLLRLSDAIRLDNRGTWFLCQSHWTVAQLERRFAEELVGSVLYARVGGILQGDKPYLFMQIALLTAELQQVHPDSEPVWVDVPALGGIPDYSVVEALKEIRVSVLKEIPDIRDIILKGRF